MPPASKSAGGRGRFGDVALEPILMRMSGESKSLELDRAELAHRLRSQGDILVVQVAAMVQGGILSAAAFSLIEIFRIQDAS